MKKEVKINKELLSSILITFIFFGIYNIFFKIRYEEIDDFAIMNLISKSDGIYSIYGIYIHPALCGLIVLLYKTSININWYSITLLVIQFTSFSLIGYVFIKRQKRLGVYLYILFISMYYSLLLLYFQYTSIAALSITAGMLLIMYYSQMRSKKSLIVGIIYIIIGTMLRKNAVIITLPFFFLYLAYKFIKNKEKKYIYYGCIVVFSVLLVIVSWDITYKLNPIYKEFQEFNKYRTQLHDYNSMTDKKIIDAFEKAGLNKNDKNIFYIFAFCDENVYNTETLKQIVENIEEEPVSISDSSKKFFEEIEEIYYIPLIYLAIITFILVVCNNKDKYLTILIFISALVLHFGITYMRTNSG